MLKRKRLQMQDMLLLLENILVPLHDIMMQI